MPTLLRGGGAIIGDMSAHSLEEIWKGEWMQKLRRELMNNAFESFKICERCPNWAAGEPSMSMDTVNGIRVRKTVLDAEEIYEVE